MKKRVVLINPPSPFLLNDRDFMPLGLLHIASYLREKGIDIQFLDLASVDESNWVFPSGDIFGISVCVSHDEILRKMARKIKDKYPNSIIVAGGPHASTCPEHILSSSDVDIAVKGEGEISFYEIASGKNISDINGIFFKQGNAIISNPEREVISDIDSLPYPAWDLLNLEAYNAIVSYHDVSIRGATIITARGCPFNCAFCGSPFLNKRVVRFHSVGYVLKEIEILVNKYGFKGLCFVDDVFTLDKKRLLEICDGLKKFAIKWRCLARCDTVNFEMLKAMKDAGCTQVDFGIESGSQKILDVVNKKVTVEKQKDAVLMAKAAGLLPKVCIIIGLPGEDEESIAQTKEFLKEVNVKCNFGFFVPLPGCDIQLNPEKYNYCYEKDIPYSSYLITGLKGYGHVFEKGKKELFLKYASELSAVLGDNYAYNDVLKRKP